MLKHFALSIVLISLAIVTTAQVDLPDGEFCYSKPNTLYWELGQGASLANINPFRMFLVEEVGDGWVEVFYEGRTAFVLHPDCLDMADLQAEADQIIADALAQLATNPQDAAALAEMGRANIMVGDYITGIDYLEQALVLDPTNRFYNSLLATAYTEIGMADVLMQALIPNIELEDTWYIEGKGTENIIHSFYDDIPIIGNWMILKLATWTYIAVPEGWILADDIGNSFIGLDLEMTETASANPSVFLRVVQDFYQGPIEAMPNYLYDILSSNGNAVLLDSAILNQDTGYVLIRFAETPESNCCWLLAFSRALPTDVDGGWRIFIYSAKTEAEWLAYYPLMQGIISNARSHAFIPIGVMLPQGLSMQEPSTNAFNILSIRENLQTTFIRMAYQAEVAEQYERALINYTLALVLNPTLSEIRLHRAQSLLILGNSELAASDYHMVLAQNADAVQSLIDSAYALRYTQPRASLELLTIALETLPDAADLYSLRAEIYQRFGENDLALADYEQALSLNPQFYEARIARARLYTKLGEYELALADYNSYISQYDLPREVLERGQIYYELGNCEAAMADFTSLIESSGGLASGFHSAAYTMRGRCQMDLGNYELAIADFQSAIETERYNADPHLYLGQLYHLQNRYEEAIESYTSGLEVAQDEPPIRLECLRNRALSLRELERYDEAISDLLMVIESQPNRADVRADLGDTYFIMGEWLLMSEQYHEYERITGALEAYMEERINNIN